MVDASVAVKWFFNEIHSDSARRLLTDEWEIWSPDLIWSEVGNVLWKKWRKNEVSAEAARGILRDFRRFPLSIQPVESLLDATWEIARELGRSFYDSSYLALAASTACRLVTADRKFYDALRNGPFRAQVVWVEEAALS